MNQKPIRLRLPQISRTADRAWRLVCALTLFFLVLTSAGPVQASPGLCTGPVCADGITRSAKNHWQLVLKLEDQQGHREKVVMDCRAGVLSPQAGLVDRGYARALGQRLCRYVS